MLALSKKTIGKTNDFLKKYGIYIILAIAFVPPLINVIIRVYGPIDNMGWNILYYYVGYETGFGGRKLLATICHIIFPEGIQSNHIRAMVTLANILMVTLFVFFVGNCINRRKMAPSLWPIIIAYAICPFSIISFMSSGFSVMFTETYQIILTLLWTLIWMKYRWHWSFYLITLFITIVCCLQHHVFCCLLFPLFVGLFAYETIDDDHINIVKLIGYGFICCVMLGLLFIIWENSQMNITIEQLGERLSQEKLPQWTKTPLKLYYYLSNDENVIYSSRLLNWNNRYGEFFWSIVLLSPLLVIIYYPWIRSSHKAKSCLSRWRYRICWLSVTLLTIPIFIVATDYNRWFICYFLSMFIFTSSLIAIGDRPLSTASTRMFRWFSKHPIITISLVIYLLGLHCTDSSYQFGLQEAIGLWGFIQRI